nr:reverse transcriptase domain-containing protein [Tanacetum cinerariifolium]
SSSGKSKPSPVMDVEGKGTTREFHVDYGSSLIDSIPTALDVSYVVELADDRVVGSNSIIRGCTLKLLNHPLNIDLMAIELVLSTLSLMAKSVVLVAFGSTWTIMVIVAFRTQRLRSAVMFLLPMPCSMTKSVTLVAFGSTWTIMVIVAFRTQRLRSAVMFLLPMPCSVSSASVLPLVRLLLVLIVLRSVIQPLLVLSLAFN